MSRRRLVVELTDPQFDAIISALAFYQSYVEQDGDGSPQNRGELRALDNAWGALIRAWPVQR